MKFLVALGNGGESVRYFEEKCASQQEMEEQLIAQFLESGVRQLWVKAQRKCTLGMLCRKASSKQCVAYMWDDHSLYRYQPQNGDYIHFTWQRIY